MRMVNNARAAVLATMGLIFFGGALASARTAEDCSIDLKVCQDACKGELDWCNKRCEDTFIHCGGKGQGGGKRQDTGSGPFTPKTGDHTSPTGGTKGEPKAAPRVNDTRPPMGGGVLQPKSSGADNSGPILHSGGTPGPILKSTGGSGPNFPSSGRH